MSQKAPPLTRLFFKKSGPARGYFIKHFLTKDAKLKPNLRHLNIIPGFEDAFKRSIPKPFSQRQKQRAENNQLDVSDFSKVTVITPPQTSFIAKLLKQQCQQLGVTCEVQSDYSADAHDPRALYIVFSLFYFRTLPPASQRIAFQVEQKEQTKYFTPAYLEALGESLAVIDYSRNNMEFLRNVECFWLQDEEDLIERLYFYPIAPIPRESAHAAREGILFYGELTPYRKKLLKALEETHEIEIATDLFGPALEEKLATTKVVLNIHRSQRAILETTRVSESLSHGASVVSEDVVNQGEFPELEKLIRFVPAGDRDAISAALSDALRDAQDQQMALDGMYRTSLVHLTQILDDLGLPYDASEVPIG